MTRLFIFALLICFSSNYFVQAQATGYAAGFYAGVEIGTISYNTHIIFDGVDDPAGRGGAGYGVIVGYNHVAQNAIVGVELLYHLASVPNPYTFDRTRVGFAEMDLRQAPNAGLDFRLGYLLTKMLLLYGSVGYSLYKQSVFIDGIALDRRAGGAAASYYGALRFGLGMEYEFLSKLRIRFSLRSLTGHELSLSDFGTIPEEASLTRFDVDPGQLQFLTGFIFR